MSVIKFFALIAFILFSVGATVALSTDYSKQCGATPFNTFLYDQKKLIFAITGEC